MNLTREQIEDLSSGRELDSLIALEIFDCSFAGYVHEDEIYGKYWFLKKKGSETQYGLQAYSTNKYYAFDIVSHFVPDKVKYWSLDYVGDCIESKRWQSKFLGKYYYHGKTPEEAICKAALGSLLA